MSLITYLTRIHFAERVLEDALPEAMRRLSARRPLLLADEDGLCGEGFARLEDALPPGTRAQLLPTIAAEPDRALLQSALAAYQDGGCDVIVALGGTAALTFARMLAAMPGAGAAGLPLIAVPATVAGVGLGPVHPPVPGKAIGAAVPAAILCDPTLSMAIGPERTAAHGFDALTHCIEAFLSTAYNPPADGIALEGIRRATLHLERAVADRGDLEAQRELLAVALNAGLAAQKGLGGVAALARAAEAEWGLARRHGTLNAALMRPVLTFNAPAVGDRYRRIAEAMVLPPDADVTVELARLGARLGLPDRIGALRTGTRRLSSVARKAAADPANQTNPRHATPHDYLVLLEEAF
ncbi:MULTISPECIES: iron-containing alcohol dehydrogenase [unclassified Roseitalea]|uniref:iron-containing alcohol dehydrogenase n=1 Tax=unclassified Roseitalea TaxID=2639107 RepID=UPI00273D3ED5|nr:MULTISPECIES: iron-containing alcohol dehydrogenase [unclassified Roseitalea]